MDTPGFAHGFSVLSDEVDCSYKCTAFHRPADEGGIIWNEPSIGIEWPIADPVLSHKDMGYPRVDQLGLADLPQVTI